MRGYHVNIFWSEEDGGYIADLPDLEACSAFGDTPEEALSQVERAKGAWLAAARERRGEDRSPSPRPTGDLPSLPLTNLFSHPIASVVETYLEGPGYDLAERANLGTSYEDHLEPLSGPRPLRLRGNPRSVAAGTLRGSCRRAGRATASPARDEVGFEKPPPSRPRPGRHADYAALGRGKDHFVVGIVHGPVNAGKGGVWTLDFPWDGGEDALCAKRAKIELESLEENEGPEEDQPHSGQGLNLSDDRCDAFHIYWNPRKKQFDWWRL